jgi:hypothetical protein
MDKILSFFSDLILVTAGLVVLILWIALFIAIGIEIWDAFHNNENEAEDGEEEVY